ncbi:unnamed protein product, partial [Heterosigma akashiwo]
PDEATAGAPEPSRHTEGQARLPVRYALDAAGRRPALPSQGPGHAAAVQGERGGLRGHRARAAGAGGPGRGGGRPGAALGPAAGAGAAQPAPGDPRREAGLLPRGDGPVRGGAAPRGPAERHAAAPERRG